MVPLHRLVGGGARHLYRVAERRDAKDAAAARQHVAVFEARPDRSVYNPLGAVHGGYAATLLDSACGVAIASMLGPNRGHTTLELKISYLRALTEASGMVRATGRVISLGSRVGFSEATLHDGDGRLCATATSTLLVFDARPDVPGQGMIARGE